MSTTLSPRLRTAVPYVRAGHLLADVGTDHAYLPIHLCEVGILTPVTAKNGARIAAVLGGLAIAIGVLTFSKRVMMTVGGEIAKISQVDGFVVIVASALTVLLMGKFMGIPVSTSQSVVGAVIGAGLVNGVKTVNFGVFKRIAIAWVSSPTAAGLLTYLVALATKSYFA